MRLYAKFFICAMLVISSALLLSGYLLITYSHENAINREADRAINQYQYDKFTVQADLISNAESLREGIPQSTLSQFASNLSGLTAFFAEDKTLLYSDLPQQINFTVLDDVSDNSYAHQFQTVEGENYIMVCGRITQSGVTLYLLIATDISAVVAQKEQMIQSFQKVYSITLLISMAVILLLSALITRPIKRLNKAASEIARGCYSDRLPVGAGDEIGELSKNFNMMTHAVEDKINELSENARQKEEFVANFAHELKTPLTSMIGYADMLYQKTLTSEQVKDVAWYIVSEGLRLEALSLKLMDLIVLNRQEFTLEEMMSDELLESIADSMKPVFEERNVTFQLKAYPAYVKVEYDLFKTLLINLIDNAMKAECSRIEVIGKPNGDKYDVSISDNGRGIPASELHRITEAFYMVDKSRSRKQHGAGLGLSLAARIAEIHGCSLKFSSSEGIGTIVSIELLQGGSDDE